MKAKKTLIIVLVSILVILGVITLFAFKASGSNERDSVYGCIPYNVVIRRESEYKAVIDWSTEDDCLGYITYGDDRDNLDFIALDTDGLSSKNHIIFIDKLLPSQTYFFLIHSGENSYGNKGLPLSFSLSSL